MQNYLQISKIFRNFAALSTNSAFDVTMYGSKHALVVTSSQ